MVEKLIEQIKKLESYKEASFYCIHLPRPLYRVFLESTFGCIPFYIHKLSNEVKYYIDISNLSQYDIFSYISNPKKGTSYFLVAQNILRNTLPKSFTYTEIYNIASGEKAFPKDIIINKEVLAYALTCFIIDKFSYKNFNINSLVLDEKFIYTTNDYKLTKIEDHIVFKQNGFIYKDKYYLYSIFIDKSPLNQTDFIPSIFKIILDNIDIDNMDFYLRLDERLAIPLEYADIGSYMFFEKWRGCIFDFSNTKLEKLKNLIIHWDVDSYDKLLMVIKKDYDNNIDEEFWHIELETLPFKDSKDKYCKNVTTTFIHGKYYPIRKVFRHIDFIKNQYPFEKYLKKYNDNSTGDIKIDFYTTKECHYKIWCIENVDIKEDIWYQLVSVSLKNPYLKLFNEILETTKETHL